MLSSIDLISVCYKKDNNIFIIGLNEKGFPPTLISPKPKVLFETLLFQNEMKIKSKIRGGIMSDILSKFTNEEIYNSCINRIELDYKINIEEDIVNRMKKNISLLFQPFSNPLPEPQIINRYYESN